MDAISVSPCDDGARGVGLWALKERERCKGISLALSRFRGTYRLSLDYVLSLRIIRRNTE